MAKRLDSIPETEELRLDGHAHIYTNYREAANRCWLEKGERNIKWLTQLVLEQGINTLGITNFTDGNFEFWTNDNQLQNLPDSWGYYQDNRVTAILTDSGNGVYYFKNTEVPTKQGHISVWGVKSGRENNITGGLSIDETLDIADKEDVSITVADHLYSSWGGLRGNLDGREERFDAYEVNASVSKVVNEKVKERAGHDGKPLFYATDGHDPEDIGLSHIIIPARNIEFSDGDAFLYSVFSEARKNRFGYKEGRVSLVHRAMHMVRDKLVYHPLSKVWPEIIE